MQVSSVGVGQFNFDKFLKDAQNVAKQAQVVAQNPFKAAINRIEFRNALTQPMSYSADELLASTLAPADPKSFTRFLKPTLEIDSPLFGKKVIAPYGEAKPNDWRLNFRRTVIIGGAALFAIFALSFAAGYSIGKKKQQ